MKGASSTARLIAVSIVLQDHQGVSGQWLPPATIELSRAMLATGGFGARALLRLLKSAWVRRFCGFVERHLLPGIQSHYVLRKHRIADWARQAIDEGVSQVLILGAGMDGLGADLGIRHPGLSVFEFDHPSTQAIKKKALATAIPSCGLILWPADLSGSGASRHFEASGLRRNEPVLIVAEGLLMYLRPRVCLRLLKDVSGYFRGRLEVIVSAMENGSDGKPGFAQASPLIDRWLHWRGEPFRWGVTPDRMTKLLRRHGLAVLAIDRGDEAPRSNYPGWSPCTGETLYRAARE